MLRKTLLTVLLAIASAFMTLMAADAAVPTAKPTGVVKPTVAAKPAPPTLSTEDKLAFTSLQLRGERQQRTLQDTQRAFAQTQAEFQALLKAKVPEGYQITQDQEGNITGLAEIPKQVVPAEVKK